MPLGASRVASRVAARGSHGWCLIEQSESDLCDFVIASRVGTAHHNVIIACNVFCEQMKRDCSAWRMVKLKGDWWAIGEQLVGNAHPTVYRSAAGEGTALSPVTN